MMFPNIGDNSLNKAIKCDKVNSSNFDNKKIFDIVEMNRENSLISLNSLNISEHASKNMSDSVSNSSINESPQSLQIVESN